MCVDEDVQKDKNVTELDVVANVLSSATNAEEEEEEEATESKMTKEICSLTEAKQFIHELKRFFESNSRTTDSDFSHIHKIEQALSQNMCQRQSSIQDFFR